MQNIMDTRNATRETTPYAEILTLGYLKQTNEDIFVPMDILRVIAMFCGAFGLDMDFCLTAIQPTVDKLQIHHIFQNKAMSRDIRWIRMDPLVHAAYLVPGHSFYSIACNTLPSNIREQLVLEIRSDRYSLGHSVENASDNGWKCFIYNHAYFIGIHRNPKERDYESWIDNVIALCLPDNIRRGVKHTLYDKTRQRLYAVGDQLYGLNLQHDQGFKKWNWIGFGRHRFDETATIDQLSCCMVDKDRFIAMLCVDSARNGTAVNHGSSVCELFALNCHQSIPLSSMGKARNNPYSVFHEQYHHGGGHNKDENAKGMERYDINQDKWMPLLESIPCLKMHHLWISDLDPNLLFMTVDAVSPTTNSVGFAGLSAVCG